jgi:hypothetical protein
VNRKCVFGITTGLPADVPGIESRQGKTFYCYPKYPTVSGGATQCPVQQVRGGQSGRGVKLTSHLLVRRLRMNGAISLFPPSPLMPSWLRERVNLVTDRKQSNSIDDRVGCLRYCNERLQ